MTKVWVNMVIQLILRDTVDTRASIFEIYNRFYQLIWQYLKMMNDC